MQERQNFILQESLQPSRQRSEGNKFKCKLCNGVTGAETRAASSDFAVEQRQGTTIEDIVERLNKQKGKGMENVFKDAAGKTLRQSLDNLWGTQASRPTDGTEFPIAVQLRPCWSIFKPYHATVVQQEQKFSAACTLQVEATCSYDTVSSRKLTDTCNSYSVRPISRYMWKRKLQPNMDQLEQSQ